MGSVAEWFVLHVRDKTGASVDLRHFKFTSIESAAGMGHIIQTEDGYSVTILDRSTKPPTKYGIDAKGKPFPVLGTGHG